MSQLLRLLTNTPAPAAAAPTWHVATVGRRRSFLSAHDALAYERGYRNHPAQPKLPCVPCPEWDGFHDREFE